jgi:SAM-dependent methyltransferase
MHPLTRCAFNLWNLRKIDTEALAAQRFVIAVDASLEIFDAEAERLFAEWLRVPVAVEQLVRLGEAVRPGDVVLLATESPLIPSQRDALLAEGCIAVVDAAYPEASSFASDCLREVAHHEFELGGLNEWNGAPTLHASEILRRLSAAHCRRSFPEQILRSLGLLQPNLDVVDIGCGPISLLRWGQMNLGFRVTGFDPLMGIYDFIKRRHGLHLLPAISPDHAIEDVFENALSHLAPTSIDLIYSNNALDHVQDFARCIRNIATVLRPGAVAIVSGSTKEGTQQNWDQFHKTDVWVESDVPMFRFQHSAPEPLLALDSRLVVHAVIRADDQVTCFVLRRRQ